MSTPDPDEQTADRTGDDSPPVGSLSRRRILQSAGALGLALAAGSESVVAQPTGNGGDTSGADLQWEEVGADAANPTAIDFDPQGRLWIANKEGRVDVFDPESGESTVALTLSVFEEFEHGLVGLTVDPDFAENNWIFVFYSPVEGDLDPTFGGTYNLVSRFTVDGDEIDPASEEEIIRIEGQREQPFHIGGGLDFGPEGALYIALGDNTHALGNHVSYYLHPQDSANTGDSRGTSMDTSDLRGSILRIVPEADGSYSIPEGNLFPEDEYAAEIDDGTVRPEIYAMGFRNPYQIDVDPETGWLYSAGQATQATDWDANYGPPGLGPVFRFREPGVLGWPMFRGGHAYIRPDEVVSEYQHLVGEQYDPSGPINASPRNDGLRELPPVSEDALLAYAPAEGNWDAYLSPPAGGPWEVPDDPPGYPELTDYSPIAGTLIRADETAIDGIPDHYDGTFVFGLWNTGDLYLMSFDDEGEMTSLEPFLTDMPNASFTDAAMGPDNRLYIVDWGGQDFTGANNRIYRLEAADDTEPEIETEFVLEGEFSGWYGVSPPEIAGEENPTLELEPGAAYRVEWTNTDGIPHNFEIRDEDETELLATELIGEEGETQTVEFVATEEMDHYLCTPHPNTMLGQIGEGEDDEEPEREDNLGEPVESITVEMTAGNEFVPRIAHVEVGGTVTWEFEGGQPHDTVAYHPDTYGDQERIPDGATPWASDVLGAGGTFEHTFEEPGVYDYVCTPHEPAGMVGTVVVGWPDPDGQPALEPVSSAIHDNAAEILETDGEDIAAVLEAGPALELNGYEPGPYDGSDLYYDVTGDGNLGFNDVVTFFEHVNDPVVQNNPQYFDFSGSGSVGFNDVVALFEQV
ncbi:PQQ-dependent sugar dehydrogenase [Natronobiforma cellulositropha]|uniref:PQQ-dependent sugar dehydrogenase n=1 Tax=Natronobiforma cellulositropha TaxID=1679076 RepID=UPI0021D56EF0|nr:PQQ-dependent sugar dehydrogenase [Natronobiforma cellulositropha]